MKPDTDTEVQTADRALGVAVAELRVEIRNFKNELVSLKQGFDELKKPRPFNWFAFISATAAVAGIVLTVGTLVGTIAVVYIKQEVNRAEMKADNALATVKEVRSDITALTAKLEQYRSVSDMASRYLNQELENQRKRQP